MVIERVIYLLGLIFIDLNARANHFEVRHNLASLDNLNISTTSLETSPVLYLHITIRT
jgi:hypothetical protein